MSAPRLPPRLFVFAGGDTGDWRVRRHDAVCGAGLPAVAALSVSNAAAPQAAAWQLRGITSNERYVTRSEKRELVARQQAPGRPRARRAALIPIRKSAAWWALTQDERREVFEARSEHIAIGLRYLPAIARRLHHCRDLGPDEPFDFLTWFDFAPQDEPAFDRLLDALRRTPEWSYVEREADLRLER